MFKDKFRIAEFVCTFFYSGKSKICPGTIGSIATLPLWFFIMFFIIYCNVNPILTSFIITILIYCIGYWATKIYITETKLDDPKEIVIDEVVGQLLSFIFSFLFIFFVEESEVFLTQIEYPNLVYFFMFVVPFLLFRFFDIKKPLFIGLIDSKIKNAHGIMLDDVAAGICAGITNSILILILIKFF